MAESKQLLEEIQLNEEEFVVLLTKLIGESKYVQNNPPELIPSEDKIIKHVQEFLAPYTVCYL